ncbi:uncharacterized protein LOC116845042 [Odontomachus brunneus]|uniref:uncharacterized protein LOC116845042 n=1 Tax=Odontomachus brunneus TaxID=486640 RepID=UPI0013F23D2B|nr:uncharacterized protein LOC116845042 [Odontomachus brunneus]
MTVLPMIPFFLGYLAQNTSNVTPSYIFHVQIDTLISGEQETRYDGGNFGMKFKLICQPYIYQSLKCHISKITSSSPSMGPALYDFFTPIVFTNIPCVINFDSKGATSYYLLKENVKDKEIVLEVFRFIGHQLSVGVDLTHWGYEFNAFEDTVMGTCATMYRITQKKAFNYIKYFELVSLIPKASYIMKKNETVLINKHRLGEYCSPQNGTILGMILSPDLVMSNVTSKAEDSHVLMAYTQHDFYTKSVNEYSLYEEQGTKFGFVQETINLKLGWIES